jgi:hypothetical protein
VYIISQGQHCIAEEYNSGWVHCITRDGVGVFLITDGVD